MTRTVPPPGIGSGRLRSGQGNPVTLCDYLCYGQRPLVLASIDPHPPRWAHEGERWRKSIAVDHHLVSR